MTGEIVLRDWVLLSKEQIVHTYKMLLEFVAQREDLSHYAQTEFLRSVAMILKRGIFDGKTGDQEEVFELIHNLLVNQHQRLVAETTLSWNFASKIFRRVFSLCQTTNSFRPPASWKDLLENDEFFTLFFQIHAKIRTDEALSLKSLSCIVQLAGLSGEVMASSEFTEHYVKLYIGSLMELFAEGPLPHEVNHFCTIINRLFQYRPIQTIMRIGPDLRRRAKESMMIIIRWRYYMIPGLYS
ncbi:hypothetical protein NECAME_12017 [Necator americanus]|uniref:Uncharacterized protein n=1 Tax=Necator americanus TaxID=51031 RepID=W2T1S2_NECAM|nr:hypothetical protein NECAME_12017 [Necator americanus]ETN75945.1 hypothetical protein NECAME_12017 [Necator americanus]